MARASSRPIRIAHVIQNLNYGGMERMVHQLVQRLEPLGFELHVVVLQFLGQFAEGLAERATLHQVPPMSRLSLLYPGKLVATLRAIDPDIVHSHAGVWLKGARAARSAGVRSVVHTEHGRPDPVPFADRLIDNLASRSTDVVIAVSEPLAEVLRQQVVHDPLTVTVIANGVDTERLRPIADRSELRASLGIPEGATVIGSVGRLEPIKNYQLAIDAFARLGDRMPDGTTPWLVLIGDGSERGHLERKAAEAKVTARVRFLGWRTDADRIYGAFDLFTLSSDSEGTSVSLLEAMSCGVCPVVTDVGGNRRVLGEGLASLLVAAGDAPALAATWQRWLGDGKARQQVSEAARRRVIAAYSVSQAVQQHADLYRTLAATGAAE